PQYLSSKRVHLRAGYPTKRGTRIPSALLPRIPGASRFHGWRRQQSRAQANRAGLPCPADDPPAESRRPKEAYQKRRRASAGTVLVVEATSKLSVLSVGRGRDDTRTAISVQDLRHQDFQSLL